jgi:hypothetical protein
LSIFSKFINLEKLVLEGNCSLHGSLELLKKNTTLRELYIGDTDIDSGLEFLPRNLNIIDCYNQGGHKCLEIKKDLGNYYDGNGKHYDFQLWSRHQLGYQ